MGWQRVSGGPAGGRWWPVWHLQREWRQEDQVTVRQTGAEAQTGAVTQRSDPSTSSMWGVCKQNGAEGADQSTLGKGNSWIVGASEESGWEEQVWRPEWRGEMQSRLRWGRYWRTQIFGGEREAEKASKTSTVRILAIFRKLLCKVCRSERCLLKCLLALLWRHQEYFLEIHLWKL